MPTKLITAEITLGDDQLIGLMDPTNEEYFMGVSQLAILLPNSVSQDHATRTVKAILGEKNPLAKRSSDINSRAVNVITVPDQFTEIIIALAIRKDTKAIGLVYALMKETIERRFDKGFEKRFSMDHYNERLKERVQGTIVRKSLCGVIKQWLTENEMEDPWLYKNVTQRLYALFTGVKSVDKLRVKLDIPTKRNIRDYVSARDLRYIQQAEDCAARLISELGLHPMAAIDQAVDRLLLKDKGLHRNKRL